MPDTIRRTLVFAALLGQVPALARPPARARRVVVVGGSRPATQERILRLFAERGWRAGENLELEFGDLEHVEPAAYASAVRRGGLPSLSPDFEEGERQAVAIVDRILRGEDPARIRVHEVTRYHVVVNARTARGMGLGIPASILLLAREVIE